MAISTVVATELGATSLLALALAGQLLMAVQPVLMSAITAGVTAKTVKEEPPTGGNAPTDQAAGASTEATGSDPGI